METFTFEARVEEQTWKVLLHQRHQRHGRHLILVKLPANTTAIRVRALSDVDIESVYPMEATCLGTRPRYVTIYIRCY